jgi:NAD(P)-dependent dehydrogenase (short-subunit alcohol dehydrogenase family)
MKHYVQDKVIIITGGSSGFGFEAARILLEMKARVVITGREPATA